MMKQISSSFLTRKSLLINRIIAFFSSRYFFWIVIIFFIFQAIWVTVSFRYPMLFDEAYHLGVINLFSKGVSPMIVNQPADPDYDMYGSLMYGNASLYHYLMSVPSNIVTFFTQEQAVQVIVLRILNIFMAAAGLWLFAKVLSAIGMRRILINISLLFYSLIPLVVLVAATISYDNMLLLLTAAFMLLGVKIVRSRELESAQYGWFITIGLVATLVKFTFLPIFVAGVLFVSVGDLRIYGKSLPQKAIASFKSINTRLKITLCVVLILAIGLFIARYVVSIVKYGSPIPECAKVLSQERCLAGGVYAAEVAARSTSSQRNPDPIQIYTGNWIDTILLQLDTSANSTTEGRVEVGKPLPVFSFLMYSGVLIGFAVLLYTWRSITKNNGWIFLLVLSVVLIGVTFLFNAATYYSVHMDLNVQARYLLSVAPILLAMSLVGANMVLGNLRTLKVILLLAVLLLSTQGGGVIKHVMTSDDDWYWNNTPVKQLNENAKRLLAPLVKQTDIID